ncbi:hypothetical protein [Desulfotomaculum sp. 1211_IL3151]|uniref:hypothetical protein n=1 Tax=Desulfotomaculum sp. 1211_IL3151 TaxID=3084055 RepID=UPI002FDA7909
MFRFPILNDPRIALFGLTMFSQANPRLEKQLEFFANMLEATSNSLAVIQGEMQNYQTSMVSLASPKTDYATKPVQQQDIPGSYTTPNQSPIEQIPQEPAYSTISTMEVNEAISEQLDQLAQRDPVKMNKFLDELEQLINKYR